MKISFDKNRNTIDIVLSKGETAPQVTIRSEEIKTTSGRYPWGSEDEMSRREEIVLDLVNEISRNPFCFVSDDHGEPTGIHLSWARAGRSDTPYVTLTNETVGYRLPCSTKTVYWDNAPLAEKIKKKLLDTAKINGGFYVSRKE